MLRLTLLSQTAAAVVVAIDGWVCAGDVLLLEQEGMRWLGEAERLVLDLNGLRFIDREGLDLLERWAGKQLVVLRGGSPFVRKLLERRGLTSEEPSRDDPMSS